MAKKKLVLSVDGGGIRGLIPAIVLTELEARLAARGKNEPLCRYFDLMAGTSTGGIIVAGLACPGAGGAPVCTAGDLVDLYEGEGDEIFNSAFFLRLRSLLNPLGLFDEKYDAGPLERKLATRLGDRMISEALTKVVITAYDIFRRRAVFMTNGMSRDKEPSDDYRFRDAARATSAAPTYFEPALIRNHSRGEDEALVDGGVFANDPALAAVVEAKKLGWDEGDLTILSLGTGAATRRYPHAEVRNWGALSWINPARGAPIISILMHGQASTVSYQMANLFTDRYFRIDGRLDSGASDDMDDATPENLKHLRRVATRLIAEHDKALDTIADMAQPRAA